MDGNYKVLAGCCVVLIAALLVVGAVSHGVIRHIVQTSPLWIAIVLAARHSGWSKWAALPCFVIWLLLMTNIWMFLLGLPHFLSGTFSPTEIAMTILVGLAALVGIVQGVRMKTAVAPLLATATILLVGVLQAAAIRISLLPQIARR
jgi:uncharacterized membrane protein